MDIAMNPIAQIDASMIATTNKECNLGRARKFPDNTSKKSEKPCTAVSRHGSSDALLTGKLSIWKNSTVIATAKAC